MIGLQIVPVQVELPWPADALSPNHRSRSHWARTNALKDAKEDAAWATRAVLPHGFKHDGSRLALGITAHTKTARRPDDDNVIAACKAYRDGIAEALGIDDSLFDQRQLQWGEPVNRGRIIFTIGGEA